jgi:hypothetical protein
MTALVSMHITSGQNLLSFLVKKGFQRITKDGFKKDPNNIFIGLLAKLFMWNIILDFLKLYINKESDNFI